MIKIYLLGMEWQKENVWWIKEYLQWMNDGWMINGSWVNGEWIIIYEDGMRRYV